MEMETLNSMLNEKNTSKNIRFVNITKKHIYVQLDNRQNKGKKSLK